MLQKPTSSRVLYWPGIRRAASELATLLQGLSADGFTVAWFDAPYDTGPPPDSPTGPVARWLDRHPAAEWWIGLSLGATVAYVAAATAVAGHCPRRLTLINPIADRIKLAKERGFSLEGRWPLLAQRFSACGVMEVDIVLSTRDSQVPSDQGRAFIQCFPTARLRVIELPTNHAVDEVEMQHSLLSILRASDFSASSPQNAVETR